MNVVPDPVRVMREMLRVCRPSGRLVLLNHFRRRGKKRLGLESVDVPEDLAPVLLDAVEIGEVLYNLIENASKYAPADTDITLQARQEQRGDP